MIDKFLNLLKENKKVSYGELNEILKSESEEIRNAFIKNELKRLLEENKVKLIYENGEAYFIPIESKKFSFKPVFDFGDIHIHLEDLIREKNKVAIANVLANHFVNLYNVKTLVQKSNEKLGIFIWDGKRYVKGEEIAKKFVEDILGKYENLLEENKLTKTSILKEYLFKVEFTNFFKFEELPILSFNNVIFDWNSFMNGDLDNAFKEHDPNILVFNFIDYDLDCETIKNFLKENSEYDEKKLEDLGNKICPNAVKIFKDWVGEKWILLFELIGYALYPKYVFHKACMLVGDGSNGKSTFLRLLKDILNEENITSISLKDICENRFAMSLLYKKLANIYPDLPKFALRDTGAFKILTGEDYVSADRKFKERINFVNYAKMFFSANELPLVNDMTPAFWRRWIVVEFPNKFERIEGFYEKNFTESEKKGIIVLSILAFRLVLKRSKFSFEETESDYKFKWLYNSDVVFAFLHDMESENIIEKDINSKEETQRVYELFTKYCEKNEKEVVSKTLFSQRMEQYGFPLYRSGGKKYYKNIKINVINESNIDKYL